MLEKRKTIARFLVWFVRARFQLVVNPYANSLGECVKLNAVRRSLRTSIAYCAGGFSQKLGVLLQACGSPVQLVYVRELQRLQTASTAVTIHRAQL